MTKPRKILLIGDSHIYAIQSALAKKTKLPPSLAFEALRISTQKNGATIGDLTFDEALQRSRGLSPDDFLVALLRGNQFNSMGLIQHPQPFDIHMPEVSTEPAAPNAAIIPLQTMRKYFERTLGSGYGKQLIALVKTCQAPVACIAPPAPKEDAAHIMRNAETYFKEHGVTDFGVTPAPLRLKLWTLQQQALASFCKQHGMIYLDNPLGTRDGAGYLRREFYAGDATHGNTGYGRMVLRQVATLMEQDGGHSAEAAKDTR